MKSRTLERRAEDQLNVNSPALCLTRSSRVPERMSTQNGTSSYFDERLVSARWVRVRFGETLPAGEKRGIGWWRTAYDLAQWGEGLKDGWWEV